MPLPRILRVTGHILRPLPRIRGYAVLIISIFAAIGVAFNWKSVVSPWLNADPGPRALVCALFAILLLAFMECMRLQKEIDTKDKVSVNVRYFVSTVKAEFGNELARQYKNVLTLRISVLLRNSSLITVKAILPEDKMRAYSRAKWGRAWKPMAIRYHGATTDLEGAANSYSFHDPAKRFEIPPSDGIIKEFAFIVSEHIEDIVGKEVALCFDLDLVGQSVRKIRAAGTVKAD